MWLGPVMDEMNDDGWKSKSSYGEKKKPHACTSDKISVRLLISRWLVFLFTMSYVTNGRITL